MWKRIQIWVAFASSCQRSWRKKTVKKAILDWATFILILVTAPNNLPLTLPQNSHINGHDGDHYTADEEEQLMTLSMLQEKFQDDEMEFLATMVAPEDLTVYTVYKSKLKMFRFRDMILLV